MKKNHPFGMYALVLAFIYLLECPPSYAIAQGRVQDLDQYFRLLAANRNFNGAVLVAEHGKIVFERSFGYSDFSEHRLNRKDISFPIAANEKAYGRDTIESGIGVGLQRTLKGSQMSLGMFPLAKPHVLTGADYT